METVFGLSWLFHFLVCQYYIIAVDSFGLGPVSAFFGTVALSGAWFVRRLVPETRGKSMAVIESELQDH